MAEVEWTKVAVVNAALVALGFAPTFTVDGENRQAAKIDAVWGPLVDQCLGLHDWSWARRTALLTLLGEAPADGWRFAHQLPGDRRGPPLRILANPRRPDLPLRDYRIEADAVHSDEPVLWATCRVSLDPTAWDPAFRAAFITALEGKLAVPLAADDARREARLQEAFGTPSQGGTGGLFGRLIAIDRAGAPIGSPLLAGDPLTAARYG